MFNCYVNGNILPEKEATLGVSDLALLRGYGVFDFFVFEHFQPRFLDDYLQRFYNSGAQLGLVPAIDKAEMALAIKRVIASNGQPSGGIRLLMTGGYSDDGYTPGHPNLLILQTTFPHPPAYQFEQGVAVMTYHFQREMPGIKSINYLTGIRQQAALHASGADFILYHDGIWVRESDRSNFLIINAEGALQHAQTGVLAGITRAKVEQLAHALGIPVSKEELPLTALATAREAFITSSTKGVLPVTRIDGRAVADGKPGPLSQQLQQAFLALVEQDRAAAV